MSNPTYVKLTGWVTKKPELRLTNTDRTPVCTIRMGTAPRWLDRSSGEWKEGPASYFDVVCWRGLAKNVSASVDKGDMITVHGTFRAKTWTDRDNNPRTQIEITASSVGHEMLYGWSHYNRFQTGPVQVEEQLAAGEANRGLDAEPDSGQDEGYQNEEAAPAVRPAYEPDGGQGRAPDGGPAGERVFGTGDEDDAGTSEAAADGPRLEEVAVPV